MLEQEIKLENAARLPAHVKRVNAIVTVMKNVGKVLSVEEIIVVANSSGIQRIVVKSPVRSELSYAYFNETFLLGIILTRLLSSMNILISSSS